MRNFVTFPWLDHCKKKITENATRYYSYFSRGQNSIFWWMQHVYICWGFFFGWVCLFLRIEKSMKQKRREKKKFCTKIPAANVLRNLIFLRLLIYFQGRLFDQKSSISTFNRFITWHVCCCLFSSKKMYAS